MKLKGKAKKEAVRTTIIAAGLRRIQPHPNKVKRGKV